eukprot:12922477-Prorocentrum_lima.AAC.1
MRGARLIVCYLRAQGEGPCCLLSACAKSRCTAEERGKVDYLSPALSAIALQRKGAGGESEEAESGESEEA